LIIDSKSTILALGGLDLIIAAARMQSIRVNTSAKRVLKKLIKNPIIHKRVVKSGLPLNELLYT